MVAWASWRGAFSGKDRRRSIAARLIWGVTLAKNIVASGLATRAEIQFAYAIGHPNPVSVA